VRSPNYVHVTYKQRQSYRPHYVAIILDVMFRQIFVFLCVIDNISFAVIVFTCTDLFICGLFNDAVDSSDYTGPNGRMVTERTHCIARGAKRP
jgi:hypothetical protein